MSSWLRHLGRRVIEVRAQGRPIAGSLAKYLCTRQVHPSLSQVDEKVPNRAGYHLRRRYHVQRATTWPSRRSYAQTLRWP